MPKIDINNEPENTQAHYYLLSPIIPNPDFVQPADSMLFPV